MKELLYLKDDQLKDLIEKLFVGYREIFSDSKKVLDKYSIGLAHHKVFTYCQCMKVFLFLNYLKNLKLQNKA